jgi:CPA2 family monovalent cation:H+ antiporter-2
VLQAARPDRARLVLVTTPDPFQARAIVELARQANPAIAVVVRTHTDEERAYLQEKGVELAVMGERELARAMAGYALAVCGLAPRASSAADDLATASKACPTG